MYSSLAITSFKLYFSSSLDITNPSLGVIGGSLEFFLFSLDIVDLGISVSSGYKSFYSASDILRASFYSKFNLSS